MELPFRMRIRVNASCCNSLKKSKDEMDASKKQEEKEEEGVSSWLSKWLCCFTISAEPNESPTL
jgi:hypothetical protein